MLAIDCIEWEGGRTAAGYGETFVGGKVVYAHRIAYEEARGPIQADHDVHHRCGNRACVNPDHLELIGHAAHARLHSTGRGHKLTGEDIPRIRALLAEGRFQREVAGLFGVSQNLISQIARGVVWSHA